MPVFIVDKPLSLTSHDVVARVRRSLGTRRVGHAGTLDPLATGVLVVLTGEDTKLSPFLTESDKHYLAWVAFGASTPTLDAEGPVLAEADAGHVDADAIRAALPKFLEMTEQTPPQHSAIKRGGVKGYEAARRGEALELPPRPVAYRGLELLAFAPTPEGLPTRFAPDEGGVWKPADTGRSFELPKPLGRYPSALLSLTVAAGTYIRAFARDLGARLSTQAHLSGLVRTRAGRADLAEAVTLEDLMPERGLSARDALPYPQHVLSGAEPARVRLGQRLALPQDGRFTLLDEGGQVVAVAEVVGGRSSLLRVWT